MMRSPKDVLQTHSLLDFQLPPFVRLCWVSPEAHDVWVDRFKLIAASTLAIDLASLRAGHRSAAVVASDQDPSSVRALLRDRPDFRLCELASSNRKATTPGLCAVGAATVLERLSEAWEKSDHQKTGDLLGYPACCVAAFSDRQRQGLFRDNILATVFDISESLTGIEERIVSCPWIMNPFWSATGIRILPHIPCGLSCRQSLELGEKLVQTASSQGLGPVVNSLRSIFSWPIEWSSLHGIAEMKSPVMRVIASSDPIINKVVVKYCGSEYPEAGAQGLHFPYKQAELLPLTKSKGYQRGLRHACSSNAQASQLTSITNQR